MGTCRFCDCNAGFFRTEHSACQQKYEQGMTQMVTAAANVARTGSGIDTLGQQLSAVAATAAPVRLNTHEALIRGWEQAVEGILSDNIITATEEAQIMMYAQRFGLSQQELNTNGAFTKVAYGCALRDILNTGTTSRAVITFQLPFNMLKGESLVWCFRDVPFFEEKTLRTMVGRSQGVSVRVMRGVYYRMGASRGYPVETSKIEHVDTGMLGVTTHHIYFAGPKKSFRIPYQKVVSFSPYSDGISVCRDAANAKPQTFITGEGWFIYNLVMNLSQNI